MAEQAGVFTRRQARAAGYSSWQIRKRLRDGQWMVVHGGVYAPAGSILGVSGCIWAGYLASGQGAVVSHMSAAWLHHLELTPHAAPWITVPSNRHLRLDAVNLVRTAVAIEDLDFVAGMLVTSRERTVVDCLSVLPFPSALEFQDRALQQKWVTTATLAAKVRRRFRHHGAPHLRRLLEHAETDARFAAERRLHTLLRRAGILEVHSAETGEWAANAEVHLAAGRLIAVADVLFRAVKLVIEVDGRAWHSSRERFQRDRTRQNALVAAGYTVLRFTWHDLTERPQYVVDTINDMLRRLS